jgi:small subunit ribosomal protein S2
VPLVTVQQLIDAGVHFGHQASRWNPKMKPYIYGKRHKIHIINLQETIRGLYQACHFLRQVAASGAQVMFLGTKRQIRAVVESEARRCGMPAVTERWIGGTLTNFNTVRDRLARLEELEAMEADGSLDRYKKKDQATLRREMRKIRRNLEGVRALHGMPGAIVVIDPRREEICVREAARMNVPVVCILDTDCNPQAADIVIPGNDDAMSSVQLLLSRVTDAVLEGRANMDEDAAMAAQLQAQQDVRARAVPGRSSQPPQRGPSRGGPSRGGPAGGGGGPGGPRGGGGGGGRRPAGRPAAAARLGRHSTGRFADRHGGHAESVSIGNEAPESVESHEPGERAAGGSDAGGSGAALQPPQGGEPIPGAKPLGGTENPGEDQSEE